MSVTNGGGGEERKSLGLILDTNIFICETLTAVGGLKFPTVTGSSKAIVVLGTKTVKSSKIYL